MLFILQIIALSASANKLSKIQDRAEEYAALIIEELDPDNVGYIEVYILSIFFKKIYLHSHFVKNKRGSKVNIILLKLDTKKWTKMSNLKTKNLLFLLYNYRKYSTQKAQWNEPKASFKTDIDRNILKSLNFILFSFQNFQHTDYICLATGLSLTRGTNFS